MALKSVIEDAKGSGLGLQVEGDGQVGVLVYPRPPTNGGIVAVPFRQYFTDDGESTGSHDMRVNGSTNNVVFCIDAKEDRDTYLKSISVRLGDNGASLNEFGALPALTNGVEFAWITDDLGDVIISEGVKTNLEFVRLSTGSPAIGSGTSAFMADVTGGGEDTYLPVIDLEATFGLPWGLRLRKNTKDKVCFTVRDNLTTLDSFNIIAFGIQVVE